MKDKYGYEIIDKANQMRISSENPSGTWRDDEYEDLVYDIIELIQKKYPNDVKMQGSVLVSLPSLFASSLILREVEKHEQGKVPYYVQAGKNIMELNEVLTNRTSDALIYQACELGKYLLDCPKLMVDEKLESMKKCNQ